MRARPRHPGRSQELASHAHAGRLGSLPTLHHARHALLPEWVRSDFIGGGQPRWLAGSGGPGWSSMALGAGARVPPCWGAGKRAHPDRVDRGHAVAASSLRHAPPLHGLNPTSSIWRAHIIKYIYNCTCIESQGVREGASVGTARNADGLCVGRSRCQPGAFSGGPPRGCQASERLSCGSRAKMLSRHACRPDWVSGRWRLGRERWVWR